MVCTITEPIYRRVFDNGLLLVSEKVPWSERFEINIGIKVGSAYELPEEEGAAHFLEHLMWKRETRKESLKRSMLKDKHGIWSNADTNHDVTYFTLWGPKDKINIALNTALQDLQNFEFDKREFKREKDVVLVEIKSSLEDDDLFGYTSLNEKLFGESTLGRVREGRYENVSKLTQDKIIAFKQKWYVPNNMIISVVGNFDQKELSELVSQTFGSLKCKQVSKLDIPLHSCSKDSFVFERVGLELTHLHAGFQPVDLAVRTEEYADLIRSILHHGETSILDQKFREQEGLVYHASSELYNFFKQLSYFYFYLGCEPHKAKRAESKLNKVFDDLSKGDFSRQRFTDAKTLWKSKLSKKLNEDLENKAEALLKSELKGDSEDYRELPQRIDAMTYERTREYAREFFSKPYVTVKLVQE
ncbi:MAG: pitrilysin family protein [Nanoarchaeota archaeon]